VSEENKHYIEAIIDEADTIKDLLKGVIATGRILASDINADISWLKDKEYYYLAEAQAKRLARVFDMLWYVKQALDEVEVLKDLAKKAQGEEGGDTHE